MEIKACPFCGNPAEVFDNGRDFSAEQKEYGIKCTNKKCRMFMTFEDKRFSKDAVIRAWNRRQNELL